MQLAKAGGLNATYFRGTDLALSVYDRLDAVVDFSCVEAPTGTVNIPPDFYSVRWRGLIRAPADETVTFQTTTLTSASKSTGVEGVRLYISGLGQGELALLIDQWDGLITTYQATLSMLADRLYEIVVEYKDTSSSSMMKLRKFFRTLA